MTTILRTLFSLTLCLIWTMSCKGDDAPREVPAGTHGQFELVLHISSHNRDLLLGHERAYFMSTFFMMHKGDSLLVGLLLFSKDSGDRCKYLLLDTSGRVVNRSPWCEYRGQELGGDARVRSINGQIYFGGTDSVAVVLGNVSMALTKNPWDKSRVNLGIPSTKLEFVDNNYAEHFPAFSVTRRWIVRYSNGAVTTIDRFVGKEEPFNVPVDSLSLGLENPTYLFDPVVGRFGNEVVFWGIWKFYFYNVVSKRADTFNTEALFPEASFGHMLSEAEENGIEWFVNEERFYVLLNTDRGLFVFKYSPSKT